MWQQVKRLVELVFYSLLSTAIFFVGCSMLRESSITLDSTRNYRSQINHIRVGRSFTFTMVGSPIIFGIYKANHNYNSFKQALRVGDTVTVYYVNSTTANLQICQVEKSGRVVVGKELLESQNKAGGLICVIGGFALLCIGVWQFRRNKKIF